MYFPGKATSYWLDTVPETQYPLMPAGTEVDVAVLGGGIVSITAAYVRHQLPREAAR